MEKIPKVTCSIEAGDYLKITINGKTQPRLFQANDFMTERPSLKRELAKKLENCGITRPEDFEYIEAIAQTHARKAWQKENQSTHKEHYQQMLSTTSNKPKSVEIVMLLATKERRLATEKLLEWILSENYIYTTRHDEKSEMWIYEDGIYVPQGKTFVKEYCREMLGQAFTTTLANEVIAKIETDTFIDPDEFFENQHKEEVAIENGILHVIKRELSEFTPKKIFFNKLPVVYDPEKTCESIDKHLETILKHKEDIPVMEELFGFLLYKEYFIEKSIMLIGDGRNGKGKTLELMKRFIGADNCANVPLQQFENDSFALSELFNKMANLSGDIDSRALKYTGTFKSLTGRDLLSAPRKFLSRIHFVNYAKQIFLANELPKTMDTTAAFWNRWIIIEFPFEFVSEEELSKREEKEKTLCKIADPNIVDKLTTKDELSGLLNKALNSLAKLRKKGDFSYSKNTNEVKNMWIRKSDSFSAFLMDDIEEDWDSRIEKAVLKRAYLIYCKEHKLKILGEKEIKETLTSTFPVSESRESEGDRPYVWVGIRFKKTMGEIEAEKKVEIEQIRLDNPNV